MIASHGGAVRAVAHGTGRALAFPAKCTGTAKRAARTWSCRAPATDLNPGTRPDRVRRRRAAAPANQTTKGQNVLQKGYSATSSQYKLQVDGAAGRPSCVLVDDRKPAIQLVRSSVSVADGAWHAVECRRAGDDVQHPGRRRRPRGAARSRPRLSVTQRRAAEHRRQGRLGDNDQFQGALDDVWVRIG